MELDAAAALADAELQLKQDREKLDLCARAVNESENAVEAARSKLEQSRLALPDLHKRRLLTAYAMWALLPILWPGGYLFYLGRDTHAWLHTATFGGCFGMGWITDFFYIPIYVADYNEKPGHLSLTQRRIQLRFSWLTLLAPMRWIAHVIIASIAGVVGVNLIPAWALTKVLEQVLPTSPPLLTVPCASWHVLHALQPVITLQAHGSSHLLPVQQP